MIFFFLNITIDIRVRLASLNTSIIFFSFPFLDTSRNFWSNPFFWSYKKLSLWLNTKVHQTLLYTLFDSSKKFTVLASNLILLQTINFFVTRKSLSSSARSSLCILAYSILFFSSSTRLLGHYYAQPLLTFLHQLSHQYLSLGLNYLFGFYLSSLIFCSNSIIDQPILILSHA